MPTFLNTLSLTNIGIQGQRIYLRLRDVAGAAWIDMGNVEDLAPTVNEDENNLTTARNGVRKTAKTLTTSITDEYTWDTLDVTDPTIRAIHAGSAAIPFATGPGASAQGMVRRPGAKTICEMAVLEPGADETDSALTYFPLVEVKANGKRASGGTDAGRLSLRAIILPDETYVVPATVDAATPKAPSGYDVVVANSDDPIADLHAVLDLISAPLAANGGA